MRRGPKEFTILIKEITAFLILSWFVRLKMSLLLLNSLIEVRRVKKEPEKLSLKLWSNRTIVLLKISVFCKDDSLDSKTRRVSSSIKEMKPSRSLEMRGAAYFWRPDFVYRTVKHLKNVIRLFLRM